MPSSDQFNAVCYFARYPDLSTEEGWLNKGYMYLFGGKWFYGRVLPYQGIQGAKEYKISDNLLLHYEKIGIAEGRVPGCDLPNTQYSNEFNAAAYLARYPDIRFSDKYNKSPLLHYQQYGIKEGRHPGYEIITKDVTPLGLSSPGTTIFVQDDLAKNQTPGDQTVITVERKGDVPEIIAPPEDKNIMALLTANPLAMAAIAGAVLIIVHESKKKKRR